MKGAIFICFLLILTGCSGKSQVSLPQETSTPPRHEEMHSSNYAVVDIQKVLNSCELGLVAKEIIAEQATNYEKEFEILKRKREEISNLINVTSKEEIRSKLTEDRDKLSKKIELTSKRYKMNLEDLDKKFTKIIIESLIMIIKEHNAEVGYSGIFEKQYGDVILGKKGEEFNIGSYNDITDKILSSMDIEYPHEKYSRKLRKIAENN